MVYRHVLIARDGQVTIHYSNSRNAKATLVKAMREHPEHEYYRDKVYNTYHNTPVSVCSYDTVTKTFNWHQLRTDVK